MPTWADNLYNAQKAKQAGDKPARKARRGSSDQIIRQTGREPNSTERKFEDAYLKPMLMAGEIVHYRFHGLRFQLANGHTYCPEWSAVRPDRTLVVFEIKAGDRRQKEAGISQIKVAAESFPEIDWWIYREINGEWTLQQVHPLPHTKEQFRFTR